MIAKFAVVLKDRTVDGGQITQREGESEKAFKDRIADHSLLVYDQHVKTGVAKVIAEVVNK